MRSTGCFPEANASYTACTPQIIEVLLRRDESDGFGGNRFFVADRSNALHRLGLDRNFFDGYSRGCSNLLPHRLEMRQQFRPFGEDIRVDVLDPIPVLPEKVRSIR